jgi:hypothetical protein
MRRPRPWPKAPVFSAIAIDGAFDYHVAFLLFVS